MRGQIDRAAQIQNAAAGLNNGSVSVIAWLGYDPPEMDQTVVTAAGSDRAQAGAVSLDHFVDGLRAAHAPGPDHITAIGHSYGSVVVGDADSHGHHLAVDDIVTAGSPGMDVDHASDLDVGARHVWAGSATDDPIASPATAIPAPVGKSIAGYMYLGHDLEPHQPAFGGNVYHVDTSGHSGYWNTNSQSLLNQARVVVGLYNRVGLDYGAPPS
jgi:Alpha/beta hydrolase